MAMSAALARWLAAGLVLASVAAPAMARLQFTAVSVAPVFPPRPVAGGDGRTHLAYELSLANLTSLVVSLDRLEVLDAGTREVVSSWEGDALKAIVRLNGHDPAATLGAAQSALLFLDVSLPAGRAVPSALVHRLTTTRMAKAEGGDIHKGTPLGPSAGIPAQVTFDTAAVAVDGRPAIRLAPPLRGAGWVAANGCCAEVTSHRGAAMAFDGTIQVPERFAIDFVQIGSGGRLFAGPPDALASYAFFGVPVHAAAPGTVVDVVNDMEEQVPGTIRPGTTTDNAAGNHVVVDMGGGNYALYAHLQTGTARVKAGDEVVTGQVIGLLGNTGNSDAPHLHFHVMNGPSPLASQGLPYVFDRFVGQGRADLDDPGALKGDPVKVDGAWNAGPRADVLPLNNEVVDFGPARP